AWALGAERLKNHPQAGAASQGYVEGRVLVKMKQGASLASVRTRLGAIASEVKTAGKGKYELKRFNTLAQKGNRDMLLMKCPGASTEKLLEAFKDHPDVETVEPDYIISIDAIPNDADFDQLWALKNDGQEVDGDAGAAGADIDAPKAWDMLSSADSTVVVAVIDTGVDYTHGDLAANMWTNAAELNGAAGVDDDGNGYVDDVYGIDAANGDCDPYDDNRHGTHVAGTIAAVTDNSSGVAGVTWNRARIMALKFLSSSGSGATSDAVECIEYMLEMSKRPENRIVVMNASWGSTSASDILKDALETASEAGIIMSAAAGNDTNDCDGVQKHYPSSQPVPNVISVAATTQNDRLAYFSNYGASEVDIAAPGVNILSSVPGGGYTAISTDPFYDSMENGNVSWDPALTTSPWAITSEKAFQGSNAWSDSPGGDYVCATGEGELDYNLVSLPIDLSGQVDANGKPKDLMLGFWLYKDLLTYVCPEGHRDTLYVEFSGDGGETWTMLAGQYGSDPNWKNYAYAIPSALLTSNSRIRFRLHIYHHGVADGVYIDKVGIGEANAMGAFEFLNGTSMAAPHVSGAVALMASLYPNETMDDRISRLLNGAKRLDALKGVLATDGRLDLAASLQPDLPTCPLVKEFELVEDRRIKIEGAFFGATPGKVTFHDSCAPDSGVDGVIVSWSDGAIVVDKPIYSGSYFYVVNEQGVRSGRRPMKVSLWGSMASSWTKRDSGAACLLDGKIYTFGGFAGGNNALRSWEVYTVDSDSWEYPYGNWMPTNKAHLSAAALDGNIYLIGGYTTQGDGYNLDEVVVFDPKTRVFTATEGLPAASCLASAAAVDGKIYVSGGLGADDAPMKSIFSFDPTREEGTKWRTESAVMSTPRFAHGSVAVNGKVYIFGGLESWEDENVFLSTGEIFDPAAGTFKSMASMPIALARFGTACDGRYIYVVGGTNNDFWYTPMDVVLRYDTSADAWSSLSERQLARGKLSAPAVFVSGKGLFSVNGGFYNTEATGVISSVFEAMDETAFLALDSITDADGDLVPDKDDNCRLTANSGQLDGDSDGYGDRCDCDLNNDGKVGQADLTQLRGLWGSGEALADFNGDGSVNQADLVILRGRWGSSAPFE
ncbi:MAG: S8 family serine peptidase, partial [Syntrophobacteraceae bacterium]